MTVDQDRLETILRQLRLGSAIERFDACETIVDWLNALSSAQGSTAGRALAEAAADEVDDNAREAEFNALRELWTANLIARPDLGALSRRARSSLTADDSEHLAELEEDFGPLVSD